MTELGFTGFTFYELITKCVGLDFQHKNSKQDDIRTHRRFLDFSGVCITNRRDEFLFHYSYTYCLDVSVNLNRKIPAAKAVSSVVSSSLSQYYVRTVGVDVTVRLWNTPVWLFIFGLTTTCQSNTPPSSRPGLFIMHVIILLTDYVKYS